MEQSLSKNDGNDKDTVRSRKSYYFFLVCMIRISLAVVVVCLCIGRYRIKVDDVMKVLLGKQISNTTAINILYHIRIPRICVSYVIGVALSISGAVYQSLFNNRLVSPGILGVEAGSCVGAGLCILLGSSMIGVSVAAFIFGIFSAFLAVFIQKMTKSDSPTTLILAGIVVSALMNALIGLIKYLADSQNKLASITFWMLGDISGAEMEDLFTLLPVVLVCSTILIGMRWRLNALALGEYEAKSLGINYRVECVIVVICATLLTSISVSVSGTIGWVGLIIPNVARGIVGNDNQKVLPSCVLLGGCFMVIVDTIARTAAPSEIPLGIITGLLGAITYVTILIKKGARA